ncbi:hypothetical protein HELRODRAFT_168136 [Helobdella robusta]|uniref:BTB domain-containing protein n=1 Tax=Helobdella robusta TaxID=6412 RepID=T1F077_HELRO|nr:hypothetical protein HELRODRAFT_168136 [Helobdella robusta]ESO10246.1 hypothetical protein HELRODRAFT_168136 [Helobdella robusta]
MPTGMLPGHRFVFAARSSKWVFEESNNSIILDFSVYPNNVAQAVVKWTYTDEVEWYTDEKEEDFLLNLLRAAHQFYLLPLKNSCEQRLISYSGSNNCLRYYQVADDVEALALKNYSAQIISNYWVNFFYN